jgi:tetratricopeptide (TPR) repeat protein
MRVLRSTLFDAHEMVIPLTIKRLFYIVVFSGTFFHICPAQAIDWAKVHEVTMRGIDNLYNLEIERAQRAFDSVSQMAPNDPRGPFFGSILHVFLYGLNHSEQEYNEFFNHSERVIEICERFLEQNEDDAKAKFYLGGIYGYRGLAYQMSNSILKAVKDGRKGYLYLEDAVRTDPTLYDAQMGFGLFRYLVAKVPQGYRWILNFLGFSGDLEGGLASLRNAAEKGIYTRTEAKLYLYQFLLAEHRTDEAIKYIKELLQRYPDNTLFAVLYSSWLMRSNNFDEALVWAKRGEEINSRKKLKYGEEFIYSTLGGIYFVKGEFSKARENYDMFVQKVQNKDYISNYIAYRYALSCELTGDRAKAVEICNRMKVVNDANRPWDRYNYRRGQELVATPLSEADVLILKGGNALSMKRYDEALKLYGDVERNAAVDVDQRAQAFYGMQQVYYEQGKDTEIIGLTPQLLALQPRRERWLIPHAYFKLGQAYARQGKKAEARAAFEATKRFDDYDFQESLENRVKEELRKLDES